MLKRWISNLFSTRWRANGMFPAPVRERIRQAIIRSEAGHGGELRFVVEGSLEFFHLFAGLTPRQRALDLFSLMRIWDTENNNGVLIYVLVSERVVEIVADRGVAQRVPEAAWREICGRMEAAFANGRFEEGALAGIDAVAGLMAELYPEADGNELPDEVAML